MKNITFILLSMPLGLAGCMATHTTSRPLANFNAPAVQDGGIEIARTGMLKGASAQLAGAGDCSGPGVGVVVESRTGRKETVFDAMGEPCDAVQVLFDGSKPSGQRAADPTVMVRVHDALGVMLDERPGEVSTLAKLRTAQGLPPVPAIKLSEELLNTLQTEPAAGPDPLLETLKGWQRTDSTLAQRSAEATEAGNRTLGRMVRAAENGSSSGAAAQLAAQLRERERTLAETQRRMAETMANSAENRAMTQAARDAWQTEQNRLSGELEAAKARAAQFEELASRLQQESQRKEAAYSDRISTLSGHLRVAEGQADASRRQLIMQAAAKIAEAQTLAQAAKIEAQTDQLAEASRLQAEANALMDKVLVAREVVADIEPKAGPAPVSLPILEAPVVLQAKQRTLPEILTEVLQQAAAHSGAWRAEWQLGVGNDAILAERWSLTAEATVGQILENLKQQVQAAHGVMLTFTPFAQTRVLVISGEKR